MSKEGEINDTAYEVYKEWDLIFKKENKDESIRKDSNNKRTDK